MDSDRIKGTGKEIKGNVKEAFGELTGDRSTEIEGKADQAAGKIQRKYGETKDNVRDALDDADDANDVNDPTGRPRP